MVLQPDSSVANCMGVRALNRFSLFSWSPVRPREHPASCPGDVRYVAIVLPTLGRLAFGVRRSRAPFTVLPFERGLAEKNHL
jgi:hypothetical protein